jgi:Transposase IS66 family
MPDPGTAAASPRAAAKRWSHRSRRRLITATRCLGSYFGTNGENWSDIDNYASRDRRHEHPARHLQDFTGILQADAYSGYNGLYDPSRAQGAITPALCWAHARRQFFELADIAANARRGRNAAAISPVALEAVKRIDALFDIERGTMA